ncbi:hypothetical protein [Pseudomonas sp.]|uniref:hypothetical protein n=1 Tax=Pseudomonas sp. TaxID=306 RepID=UPI003FD7E5F2
MGDKELLELAAKAAGIPRNQWDYEYCRAHGHMVTRTMLWNPDTNGIEALRLAVHLDMSVEISAYEESTYAYAGPVPRVYAMENWGDDKEAATRRAIFRAAAEVGKAMP